MNQPRVCACGSGKTRRALADAAGIFCAYVCNDCEPDVRKRYNPRSFDQGAVYATTGEEEDIGLDEELWRRGR